MPRHTDPLKNDEASEASWEAAKGLVSGGLKWGAVAAVLGGISHKMYPLYRGLTVQFKVYIQASAMIMGGMIEADSRLRIYENRMRLQRRMLQDQAKWERYEREFLESDRGK
ncbi:uncharacterized protein DNG_01163 [Cephalotrichum gorgonifer]|uniref:HIG1 domain-containing protein n=1 Tax=Cephalotrichum gorgonifer TaxID=2041049 RepID=A0AAE8SRF3_9PEZI|nr:uncharacterized protein DNG_01163 [Cephalotrichum gorgonifer]